MANANRVKETTTATSLATIALGGAATGFRTFAAGLPAGAKRTGLKVRVGPDSGGAWLIGAYDLTADGTLTRRAILDSSASGADVALASGAKEVELTFTAGQGDRVDSGTSLRMVFTSSLCVSDADVSLGSTNLGTDQGAKVQSLFDLNADGSPLLLIFDGQYGVNPQFADAAIKMHSNTKVVGVTKDCGMILRGTGDNIALLCNYDRDDGRTGISTNGPGNKTLSIQNLTLNGNGTSFRVLQMFGVKGLEMRGLKLFNSKHFHFHAGNVKNVTYDDIYVDKGAGGGIFGDGLHICGPAENVFGTNAVILNCGDDNVALNADDAWVGNTETYQPRGPIKNVHLKGIRIQGQLYGVRVLSGGSLVDDIDIEDVSGTTNGYALVVDNFIPAQTATTGPGNIGRLRFSNFNVLVGAGGDPNLKACHAIDCKIDRLVMENFQRASAVGNDYASIRFGPKADIRQLLIDGYMGSVALGGQILFYAGSKVQTAKIVNSVFDAPSAVSGYPIVVQNGASIVQLTGVGNTGVNFTDFVQNAGTITNPHFPAALNFMDSATVSGGNSGSAGGSTGGASGTWSFTGGFTEQSASAITYAGSLPAVNTAIKADPDAFNANVQVSARIRFTGTAVDALNAALIVRGVTPQGWGNSANGYYFDACAKGSVGFTLKLKTGSTESTLASTKGTIAMDTDYDVYLTAKGSTISGKVQRVSDGFWLQTDGTWAATAAVSHSATNGTLGAGSGLPYGMYGYAYNANSAVSGFTVTNFAAVAAP